MRKTDTGHEDLGCNWSSLNWDFDVQEHLLHIVKCGIIHCF